jgi:hypothetical protein
MGIFYDKEQVKRVLFITGFPNLPYALKINWWLSKFHHAQYDCISM